MMSTTLIRNATVVATMDAVGGEIRDGGLFLRDHVIEAVGPTDQLPPAADRIIDLRGHLVTPGLINTHHHLYQTLTRAVPAAQNAGLFDWLRTLYPIWAELTDEATYVSAVVGLAELLRGGCTTASDHLYLFPNDVSLDAEIRAAEDLGIRFHATRGAMSLGESQGGLPPDRVVQDERTILKDTQRVIETYHDPARYAMRRVGAAPCSPFSVTQGLMREAAALARHYGVRLHTHLAETRDEEAFCLERFRCRPLAYAEGLGWAGPDVWYAHAIHTDAAEQARMGRAGTGVAHCPSSNMRLGSGVCPVLGYFAAGVPVGLGSDGSASNDGSTLLPELQNALYVQRLAHGPDAMTARKALELGTRGGAAVLGRDDIGHLAPGMAADLAAYDMNRLEFAGAQHDPVAALVLCRPSVADLVMVHGRIVVERGQVLTVDLPPLIERHNRIARTMLAAARPR
jgi:cytosine/adenosine deaminase-related metal-dependent hydrolase